MNGLLRRRIGREDRTALYNPTFSFVSFFLAASCVLAASIFCCINVCVLILLLVNFCRGGHSPRSCCHPLELLLYWGSRPYYRKRRRRESYIPPQYSSTTSQYVCNAIYPLGQGLAKPLLESLVTVRWTLKTLQSMVYRLYFLYIHHIFIIFLTSREKDKIRKIQLIYLV